MIQLDSRTVLRATLSSRGKSTLLKLLLTTFVLTCMSVSQADDMSSAAATVAPVPPTMSTPSNMSTSPNMSRIETTALITLFAPDDTQDLSQFCQAIPSLANATTPGPNDGEHSTNPEMDLLLSTAQNLNVPYDATTAGPPANLWQRLRLGFGMRPSDNPRIATQVNWFTQHPNYLIRTVGRSKQYLYHIVNEVQKRGMPTEIALLPMIESAYNPMAYSASHASGIWQFIPSTGKNFGLRENGWYDGRRDVVAATKAALDYLERLHQQFGTWELSLAAYNCGEGCVQNAIAKNQRLGLPTDYQSLSLPAETRDYVPKLLALKQIVTTPSDTGVNLDNIPNQAYFASVNLKKSMDVRVAAKLADMPIKDFISLNPAYNKPVILSNSSTQLLLPVDKVDVFSDNLSHYADPLVSWKMCAGHRGETLKNVALSCHVSLHTLLADNHISLTRKRKLDTEQSLLIPLAEHTTDSPIQIALNQSTEFDHHKHKQRHATSHTRRTPHGISKHNTHHITHPTRHGSIAHKSKPKYKHSHTS
ncbi:MAG: transglycosylase SLT domain-containing protein [Betaproteobacteria bacterium]|nr:transglycosylase SLT domain-containing protein [Betaproteobacteria bacterium]